MPVSEVEAYRVYEAKMAGRDKRHAWHDWALGYLGKKPETMSPFKLQRASHLMRRLNNEKQILDAKRKKD